MRKRKLIRGNKKDLLNLYRWNNKNIILKRLSTRETPSVTILEAIDDDVKKGIMIYHLRATSTYNSCFIKRDPVGCIFYYYDNKKLFTINHSKVVAFLASSDLSFIGLDWAINTSNLFFNKNNIKAILKGLCTDPNDLVKRYFKSRGIKGMSFKKYKKCVEEAGVDAYRLTFILNLSTSVDSFVKNANKLKNNEYLEDLIDMSFKLGKKINFNWSDKRIKYEHDTCTNEILNFKKQLIKEKKVLYRDIPLEIEKGVKVLTSNIELLEESHKMHHCVGTSNHYFNGMNNYNKLILHYNRKGFIGTAEINICNDTSKEPFKLWQFKGKYNSMPPLENEKDLKNILQKSKEFDCLVDFCRKNRNTYKVDRMDIFGENIPF